MTGALTRLGARVSAHGWGSVVAATGLLSPRLRYGHIHPLTGRLLSTQMRAVPSGQRDGLVVVHAATRRASPPTDLVCVLATGELDLGGIGTVVELLATDLPEHGIAPVVLAIGDGARAARLRAAGIAVHDVRETASARRVLDGIRPDVVQLHAAPAFLTDAALGWGAPLVSVLHNTEIHFSRERWRRFAELLSSSSAIAVSESVRTFHAAHVPAFLHERIAVIPNASPRRPSATPDARRIARRRLEQAVGTPLGDDPVFVSLSRYDAQKNIVGTVASFVAGLRPGDGAHLVIAGEPSDWVEYRRADAIRRASQHAGRVHLLAASDGPTLLAAGDAFLLNSFFEGWPMAANEAWAAGLPLVMSDVGGARELVARDPERSVLVANPCGEPLTDARVERARRRAGGQRNAGELADAVHRVAQVARRGAVPHMGPHAGEPFAEMVRAHAEILRDAAGSPRGARAKTKRAGTAAS